VTWRNAVSEAARPQLARRRSAHHDTGSIVTWRNAVSEAARPQTRAQTIGAPWWRVMRRNAVSRAAHLHPARNTAHHVARGMQHGDAAQCSQSIGASATRARKRSAHHDARSLVTWRDAVSQAAQPATRAHKRSAHHDARSIVTRRNAVSEAARPQPARKGSALHGGARSIVTRRGQPAGASATRAQANRRTLGKGAPIICGRKR
jgi:hypothetical protein